MKRQQHLRRGVVALAAAAGLLAWQLPAMAQGVGNYQSFSGMPGAPPSFSSEQLDQSFKRARPPPAALPGAAQRQEAIAPPTDVPTLLSPNDALFDAINRGDIAGVRDALSRGADLNARNELGLTPLDLSVDLGRNAISFLLLSMRGAGSAAPPVAAATQKQPSPLAAAPAVKAKAQKTVPQRSRNVREAAVPAAEAAGQQTLPQLFAGNGGEPIPQAGFLGFGGR